MTVTTARTNVVVDEHAAAERVRDGMTIGIGGFINSGHPMVLVRQIIKRRVRNLTVVGAASAGLEIDMLLAAGCVGKLITPYVGAEGLASIGPSFRKVAQDGALDLFELDEAHFYAGLRAAAQCLPFNPWRAGVGTAYPDINPGLRRFNDPINNEPLLAIPAIDLDIAIIHAAVADQFGNAQHNGTGFGDRSMSAAADTTIVTVEQVVSNEQIKRNPAATSVAAAEVVVRAPFGAHPFASEGYYLPDAQHVRSYVQAATDWLKTGSRTQVDEFLGKFVIEPRDNVEYLERVGLRHLLSLSEF